MKITPVNDNLYQLTHLGCINCYLVRESDGFTLIDTADSGQERAIRGAAQKLGLPIARIVLTHAHIDHVGSLDALHLALAEVPVALSARDARFLGGDLSLDDTEPQTRLRGGYPVCQTKPTLLLHEGERIGSLEIIATPGHTPGHLAFFDTRNWALIAGDAFQTLGGVAVSGVIRPFFPLPAMATWNNGLAEESARKLLALQPEWLAVGHGRVLSHPQEAMECAIRVMERKLAKEQSKGAKVA